MELSTRTLEIIEKWGEEYCANNVLDTHSRKTLEDIKFMIDKRVINEVDTLIN